MWKRVRGYFVDRIAVHMALQGDVWGALFMLFDEYGTQGVPRLQTLLGKRRARWLNRRVIVRRGELLGMVEAVRTLGEALLDVERVSDPVYVGECPDCKARLMDDHAADCGIHAALQVFAQVTGDAARERHAASRW